MSIDKKIHIKAKYYTVECISKLYDFLKEEHSRYPVKTSDYKANRALYNLLDKIIIKLKKALLIKGKNDTLEFKLEYYQAYHLMLFLLENCKEYQGINERTILSNLSQKIDKKLWES